MNDAITIFYSWQSDSPKDTNLTCIRQALRTSINNIESKNIQLKIDLDEATRDTAGSPNIPKTIFEKITNAEIFVCDLTTINPNADRNARKVQNPNVLIELGYAIAHLGWNRIILLINAQHSTFPDDLPFDIDKHRSAKYKVADANDSSGKGQLISTLTEAINTILKINPLRIIEKADNHSITKRKRDLENLEKLLKTISLGRFEHFLESMPYEIPRDVIGSKDSFAEVFKSATFHLYDFTAQKILDKFFKNWEISLSYWKHYESQNNRYYKFYIPADEFTTEAASRDYEKLERTGIALSKNFKELIKYVRDHYLELDVDSICQFKEV